MAPKATVTAVTAKATSNTAKPSGLQLSAAQWKVYSRVYSAVRTKLAIKAAAQTLRQSRLTAAYSMQKKAAAARSNAQAARIAAYATRQSFRQSVQAHQNAALQARVYAAFSRHMTLLGRVQYIAGGEKAFAHAAVMRTVTTAQATTIEQARFAQAVKTAKAAVSTAGTSTAAPSAASVTANRIATAVASKSPAGRTAPRPEKTLAAESWQESSWCGAWRGDPDGYDCVAAAIANHLLYARRLAHSDVRYTVLRDELGQWPEGPPIAEALARVQEAWNFLGWARLVSYRPDVEVFGLLPGAVIGFATEHGPHAALYLGDGKIASWGEVLLLCDVMLPGTEVEESWRLHWAVG